MLLAVHVSSSATEISISIAHSYYRYLYIFTKKKHYIKIRELVDML